MAYLKDMATSLEISYEFARADIYQKPVNFSQRALRSH